MYSTPPLPVGRYFKDTLFIIIITVVIIVIIILYDCDMQCVRARHHICVALRFWG